jgi:hypothetical protein
VLIPLSFFSFFMFSSASFSATLCRRSSKA